MAVPKNPLAAFIWGAGGAALTPEELARRREMEEAILAKQGVDTSPVGHWTQGLARVANAAAGAYRRNKLEGAQTENDDYNKSLVETLFGRSSSTPASDGVVPMTDAAAEVSGTTPAVSGTVEGGPQSYRDAIASIESVGSGNYAAIGPTHDTLGRALGRYQVMEANIPQWSKEALGREITADEFMADPALQDAIFDKRFGDYVAKYGPEGAAQAWFGGEGGVGKTDRKDVLGTTVGGYGQKFLKALGNQEVASLDPAVGALPIEGALPADASVPVEGASLADEVAQFEQTPEYAAQFAGTTVQPMVDTQTALPVEQVTGRDAVAKALMEQQSQLNPAQAAITDQAAALPTADAAQAAVTGGQPVEMAQATTGQQGLSGIPTEELLRVLTDPRANANTRAVAQALMQQQEAARRQQAEQQIWMQRQQYERQQQEQDPLRQLQIQKGQLELDALRNPTAKETAQMQNLTWRAKEAGLQPGTPEYADFMRTGGTPSKDTNITVNTGEGGKFYEALDKKNAEMFATLSDEGIRGRSKLAQIDRLDQLLANAPDGGGAALKMLAGEYGINTEGLQDLQAAQALINELVPQQRQPGSGPMSDADLALFKQSLPRIINQPDGNKMIMQTMRGITEYQVKMGEIADAVADRTLTPEQGRKAIRTLENPLEGYTKAIRQLENDDQDSKASVPEGVDEKVWGAMTPEERALWK